MLDSFSSVDTPFAALALAPVPNDVTRCGTKKCILTMHAYDVCTVLEGRKWKWKQLATDVHGMLMKVMIGVKQNAHGMMGDKIERMHGTSEKRHQENRPTLTTRVTSFL